MIDNHYDIAVVGGGPAGLQATLILARLRKRIIVFDSPEPPRNGASHGVHNFLGLDGLLPSEIREQAWRQIDVYNSAELRVERVIDIQAEPESGFKLTGDAGSSVTAKHVILATGFRDEYPDVPGFMDCWADTIFSCPFCDGYENRDRVWGLVIASQRALEHLPHLYPNWTSEAKAIFLPQVVLSNDVRARLTMQGIPVHEGEIVEIHHTNGKVNAITLSTGEKVEVGTLWWAPTEQALPLTQKVIANFGLEVDETGHIKTDASHQTTFEGLWAVGDVEGNPPSALGAAFAGSQAAYGIVRDELKVVYS